MAISILSLIMAFLLSSLVSVIFLGLTFLLASKNASRALFFRLLIPGFLVSLIGIMGLFDLYSTRVG